MADSPGAAGPCGTTALGAARERAGWTRPGAPPPARSAKRTGDTGDTGDERAARDTFSLPGEALSEHFALRWGSALSIPDADADALLQHFEDSWAHQIGSWAYNEPANLDGTRFNVYLGSSGPGSPDDYNFGGYFSYDGEGYPLIVLNNSSADDPASMAMVISHEFFHAIQSGTTGYEYAGRAAWYTEATAVWASGEMYPSDTSHASFIVGYAYLPEQPIYFFDYPDEGTIEEYHQYGAFIFPQYLTEHVADPSLVRDSWVLADHSDPLVVLDGLLGERGSGIEESFADFAAHNATWDYERGAVYAEWEAAYAGIFPGQKALVNHSRDSGGWQEILGEDAPRRFGSNFVALGWPGSEELVVAFEGRDGSGGSAARWWATLVAVFDGEPVYFPLVLEGNAFEEQVVPGAGGADAVWLVASVTADTMSDVETFDWGYTLSSASESAPVLTAPAPKSCGCTTGTTGTTGGAWTLALVGLLGLARRRV